MGVLIDKMKIVFVKGPEIDGFYFLFYRKEKVKSFLGGKT